MPPVASTVLPALAAVSALSVIALLLIVATPSRRVRAEPPLDEEAETRLLLGEDPAEVAEAIDGGEAAPAPVAELHPEE
jgi:hypothetical protein